MKVGEVWRVFYQKDNPSNRRLHIRAIVDDEIVVSRTWSKRHRYWRYNCDMLLVLEGMIEDGYLIKVKSA